MANPRKTTPPTGGGGQGEGPPDELAIPRAAAGDPGPQPQSGPFDDSQLMAVHGPIPRDDDSGEQNAPPVRVAGPEGDWPPVRVEPTGPVPVSLQRSTIGATADQALWVAIRTRTRAIGFDSYQAFIERVLCQDDGEDQERALLPQVPMERLKLGVDAYQLLKAATEAFLILRCGVLLGSGGADPLRRIDKAAYRRSEEEARLGRTGVSFKKIRRQLQDYLSKNNLPYLDRVLHGITSLDDDPDKDDTLEGIYCGTLIQGRRYDPCLLELIWSYWNEEGMLVQAINAISLRFQNKRPPGDGNPLANLELHPLRPLSNLLWGYVQDEPFRLTVARRTYEYSHHYGLTLVGRAVPALRPADHRSKFLEAFHSLLNEVADFYREDADTTVIANGFPLLNGLKEVHMLLAEGAHNQFGDLPWTARVEMLIQQWLLSRRELQDFLRGRPMVPYKEPWMGQVDTLRRMLGWGDTPVTHFRDLATFGEQILLSIRYGDWINVDLEDAAKNWARYWKPEIQGYVHAFRAVTGMDLTVPRQNKQLAAAQPGIYLQRRIGQRGAR
ncbi:MAG: hypothetical protein ACJ759_01590 [Thermoanaerobaculia bacterium]